ncbi:MAG: hypothetical protein AB8G18_02805 [Gammaproteobacteria bacterium]
MSSIYLTSADLKSHMPDFLKALTMALAVMVTAITVNTSACRYSNVPEHILSVSETVREKNKVRIAALRKEADTVFYGRLVKVDGESAKFSGVVNIKGSAKNNVPYTWVLTDEYYQDCNGLSDLENLTPPVLNQYNEGVNYYLIYAVNKQIIRARIIPRVYTPSPHEEIEWLTEPSEN